jgi:8-oxo-dGTP diphosphatase
MAEFSQDFFKTAVTVDNVIFGFDESDLKVLLIKRGTEPYTGLWALPGDFIYAEENIDDAAARVLRELTGLEKVYLEQVRTFGAVGRHPLGRVLTVAYFSLVKTNSYQVFPASFAQKTQWVNLSELRASPLAFDHDAILEACFYALKQRVRVRPIGFELLPPKFTLTELQHLYEAILEPKDGLDKRNFRKKILSMDFIVDLNESQAGVAHRPARLYEFDKSKYEKFVSEGFNFEL